MNNCAFHYLSYEWNAPQSCCRSPIERPVHNHKHGGKVRFFISLRDALDHPSMRSITQRRRGPSSFGFVEDQGHVLESPYIIRQRVDIEHRYIIRTSPMQARCITKGDAGPYKSLQHRCECAFVYRSEGLLRPSKEYLPAPV